MIDLIKQITKFGIVGVIAFLIDYGLLIFFTEVLGIFYFWSSLISFTVSVLFNYYMTVKWVFLVENGKTKLENLVFFITFSCIGLGINQLIMFIGVQYLYVNYMIVKIFATFIVMVFNYLTRKWYFEHE
ncbi:GtrA family protein [Dubosiella newyorkensis]|uniref:GtrA family protein n=1 Tax=Dubosiella newyorkensis TaxID=1862672 RepID=UPI00272A0760|nr:GtrA family protein [Dubosiella newyorkensis]